MFLICNSVVLTVKRKVYVNFEVVYTRKYDNYL